MQARVLTGELHSEFFKVNVWVKQGCVHMPEHRLHRQVLYGQLSGAKRATSGQRRRDKDYTKDLLNRSAINPPEPETLPVDRSAWQVICARTTARIHDSNQQRSTERRAQRHQRAAHIPPVSGLSCPDCIQMIGLHISLDSHMKWHHRQHS